MKTRRWMALSLVSAVTMALGCAAEPVDGELVSAGQSALLSGGSLEACGCILWSSDGFEETYLCPYGWETCASGGGGGGGGGIGGGGGGLTCSECRAEWHNCTQAACDCNSYFFCLDNCRVELNQMGCGNIPNCDLGTAASCVPFDPDPSDELP